MDYAGRTPSGIRAYTTAFATGCSQPLTTEAVASPLLFVWIVNCHQTHVIKSSAALALACCS